MHRNMVQIHVTIITIIILLFISHILTSHYVPKDYIVFSPPITTTPSSLTTTKSVFTRNQQKPKAYLHFLRTKPQYLCIITPRSNYILLLIILTSTSRPVHIYSYFSTLPQLSSVLSYFCFYVQSESNTGLFNKGVIKKALGIGRRHRYLSATFVICIMSRGT